MVRRPVHQVEDLLDGAVPCGAGGKLQPSAVEADEAPAAHGAGALRPVHRPAQEALRIGKREQDRAAVMPWYEQEVPAAGFPPVAAGAGDVHGVPVVALRRLEEGGDGGIADAQNWVHHRSPPCGPAALIRTGPQSHA